MELVDLTGEIGGLDWVKAIALIESMMFLFTSKRMRAANIVLE